MINLSKVFVAAVLFLTCGRLTATGQVSDRLILDGKLCYINTNPLERFFECHPEKRIKKPMLVTSCWRGYIATFEIKSGSLHVNKIITENRDFDKKINTMKTSETDVTSEVFRNSDEMLCHWYTGSLILPEGEIINYVHMGYASTYERYRVIRIKQGKIADTFAFSYKEFIEYRKKQFVKFKKTEEYKKALAESIKEGSSPKEAEDFLFEFYTEMYLSTDL